VAVAADELEDVVPAEGSAADEDVEAIELEELEDTAALVVPY